MPWTLAGLKPAAAGRVVLPQVGTVLRAAPEVTGADQHLARQTPKADVYSWAVLMVEMLFGYRRLEASLGKLQTYGRVQRTVGQEAVEAAAEPWFVRQVVAPLAASTTLGLRQLLGRVLSLSNSDEAELRPSAGELGRQLAALQQA
jgi:hypothetical protein